MKREFTKLPPPEHTELFPDLHKLVEEHEKTLRAFREGRAEYEALKLERQRARNADGKARVEAYRAGKSDPGPKSEGEVLTKMEIIQDKTAILEQSYQAIEQDLGNLVSAHRAEWLPEVEDKIRDDDAELAGLLGQVREVLDRRQARGGLRQWILELPPGYRKQVIVESGVSEDVAVSILHATLGKAVASSEDGSVRGIA